MPLAKGVKMDASYLAVRQVAAYLKVAARTVYRPAQNGGIRDFEAAGVWPFWPSYSNSWIEAKRRAHSEHFGE